VAGYLLAGFVVLGFLTMFGALSEWPAQAVDPLVGVTLGLGLLSVLAARLARR
jgi:hypothetical protein